MLGRTIRFLKRLRDVTAPYRTVAVLQYCYVKLIEFTEPAGDCSTSSRFLFPEIGFFAARCMPVCVTKLYTEELV